ESRAVAEDACAKVSISYEPLPAAVDMETALDPATAVIQPALGDNLCFQRLNETGQVDAAFAAAHRVVEATFYSGRHTGATLDPRRLQSRLGQADGLSFHPGAAHDAERVRQTPRPA